MQVESTESPYEVRCERCRVTFPVGTRRCVHCGGRIGGRPLQLLPAEFGDPSREHEDGDGPEEDEALPVRSRLLSPFTLLWLLAAVVASVYQHCA
jgi:hypothetical protein